MKPLHLKCISVNPLLFRNVLDKPDSLEVWDWVLTHSGEVRQITHDDMQGLRYEDVAFLLSEETFRLKTEKEKIEELAEKYSAEKHYSVRPEERDWDEAGKEAYEEAKGAYEFVFDESKEDYSAGYAAALQTHGRSEGRRVFVWVKGKPLNGKDRQHLNIKYKDKADTLVFLNNVWCWLDNSIIESAKYPVEDSSWDAIEYLQEQTIHSFSDEDIKGAQVSGSLLLHDLFQVAAIENEDGMPVIKYVDKPNGGSVAYVRHDAMVKKINTLNKEYLESLHPKYSLGDVVEFDEKDLEEIK